MEQTLILGGGHGTQALSLIENQKIYFGSWDDGGSSGFLRNIYPQVLPFGDLRAVIIAKLKLQDQLVIADLIDTRSPNINELINYFEELHTMVHYPGLAEFNEFLEEYFEEKLAYLLKHSQTRVPEDSLGNMILVYLFLRGGVKAMQNWVTDALKLDLKFDFVFTEPVFLYGYYYDISKSRLKILDSETLIDTWHTPVLKFSVRDAAAEHPSINPRLLIDIQDAKILFFAPGSRENYLPALNDELIKQINNREVTCVLVAQLFLSSKDQYLHNQITDLAKKIDRLEIWLPSIEAVTKILQDSNLLLSYAVQNKWIDVFFIPEYQQVLQEFLSNWKMKSATNELYKLLHDFYAERALVGAEMVDWVVRPCLDVVHESDGWKHSKPSLKKAFENLNNQVVA